MWGGGAALKSQSHKLCWDTIPDNLGHKLLWWDTIPDDTISILNFRTELLCWLNNHSLILKNEQMKKNNYVKQQKIYFIGRSYVKWKFSWQKEAAKLAQASINDDEGMSYFLDVSIWGEHRLGDEYTV